MMWRLGLTLVLANVAMGNVLLLSKRNVTERTFFSCQSAFGRRLGLRGRIRGYMKVADPPGACDHKTLKPPPAHSKMPYFVLIARTPDPTMNCPFDLKVLNAQKVGYKAAVIHNTIGHNGIFTMHGGNLAPNVTIPSQFIGYEDSQILSDEISILNTKQIVELNGEEPQIPDPYFYIIPFFVVICIIVFILVIALIVKLCREYMHSRRSRLSRRNLKKLPTRKFSKNNDPFETCAVCLDDFEDGDKIRILPCNHAYHCQCIDPWLLKRKRNCPVCKRKIHFGRRRRDVPTAEPDSSDSDATSTPGDERTPLLGGGGSSSLPSTSAGAINSGSDEDSSDEEEEVVQEGVVRQPSRWRFMWTAFRRRFQRRRAYIPVDDSTAEAPMPASYGSFDASPHHPSPSSSHQVEVHPPPEAGEDQAKPPSAEVV